MQAARCASTRWILFVSLKWTCIGKYGKRRVSRDLSYLPSPIFIISGCLWIQIVAWPDQLLSITSHAYLIYTIYTRLVYSCSKHSECGIHWPTLYSAAMSMGGWGSMAAWGRGQNWLKPNMKGPPSNEKYNPLHYVQILHSHCHRSNPEYQRYRNDDWGGILV